MSWSEKYGAQAAAKEILLYGQELLDLVDWQTKRNRTKKRELEIVDQTSSSNVYSFNKRIRTSVTIFPPKFQSSRPNIHHNTNTPQPNFQHGLPTISPPAFNNSSPYTHTNPAEFQPNQPTSATYQEHAPCSSASTENPFNLSMRTRFFARARSSPSWNSSLPSETTHGIENSIQQNEDSAKIANSYNDEHLGNLELIPAVDTLPSETERTWNESAWYNDISALSCDPDWLYDERLELGSLEDAFNPLDSFSMFSRTM